MADQTKDNAGAPSVESLVKRGCLFLEDSEWKKADEYFDKALDINPEHAPAYIGKLCAELMVRREDSLGDYKGLRQGKKFEKPLGEYGNFQKAIRFADDGYRKKLNDYEQKIKENFPKTIPQRFTDEFIKSELARLEKEIANCDAEITKNEQNNNYYQSRYKELSGKTLPMVAEYRNQTGNYTGLLSEIEKTLASYNPLFKQYYDESNDALKRSGEASKRTYEYKNKKAEYEKKKKEIEPLAGISCLDRMDVYYNRVVEAMKKGSTEDEFKNLAEQFRSLEGYKDSAELIDKCGKLVIKIQYDKLVQEKNKAKTEEEYRELSKKFRKWGGYENSVQMADECDKLADECVKQKEREKKARYDDLLKAKNNALYEDNFLHLVKEFRKMGDYENAVQMANECDKQFNVLKEKREEQERQAMVKEAARKKAEAEALKRKEAEDKRREKQKRLNIVLAVIITIAALTAFIVYRLTGSLNPFQQNSVVISEGVSVIGEGEFSRKQLVNVEIPDSVTSIGNNAFKRNKLTRVVIPGSVKSIGENAFANNRLTSITIGSNVIMGGEAFGSGFEEVYNNNNMEEGIYKWIEKNKVGWAQIDGDNIIVPGGVLSEKLAWLQRGADSNNTYIIKINADEYCTSSPHTLEYQDKSNITIVLKGNGANRVIGLNSKGAMFTIRPNVNLVLDNITLKGLNDNDDAMINVDGGMLKMNTGSAITGNQVIAKSTGGVYVASGTFEMLGGTISNNSTTHWWGGGVQVGGGDFIMTGGTISGNTAFYGGGVQVHHNGRRGGIFTMKGGTIIGNTAREAGGGVYVNGDVDGTVGGTFAMNDGTITGNTANKHGGGVFIHNNQNNVPTAFNKTGGIITGYVSAPNTGNVVKNNSGVIPRRGHAVSFGSEKLLRRRETTTGSGMNFSVSKKNASGAWDQ